MAKHRKRREPQLRYSETRGIGWHANYRDAETGVSRKKKFGMVPEHEARRSYRIWLVEHMDGIKLESNGSDEPTSRQPELVSPTPPQGDPTTGSLLHVASSLTRFEAKRARKPGEPRRRGSISHSVFRDNKQYLHLFLEYLNSRHGHGAVGRMTLADLSMQDVEEYNRSLVESDYSFSSVSKRMQVIRALVNRAGRPEHGSQVLHWNWESKDVLHGAAASNRKLPTLPQLQKLLDASDVRGQAMIWMGVGLGFGQSDLSATCVGHIDAKGYDLRRGKTGVERYGDTPEFVWQRIQAYLEVQPREKGSLLFTTKKGNPLVHGRTDSVYQWWRKLRKRIGETDATLNGFYVLRHLGATEYGSRDGCSISDMKRWLGHSARSDTADIYMRPVAPEHREVVEQVRQQLT